MMMHQAIERYPEQWICLFDVLFQTISQMVKIDPLT